MTAPGNFGKSRTHTVQQIMLMYGEHAVPIETTALALRIPRTEVSAFYLNAVAAGELERMPPAAPPTTALERRDGLGIENANLREKLFERDALIREMTHKRDDLCEKLWLAFKLTPTEQRLVACLVTNERASKERLFGELYAHRPEVDHAEPKIIDVMVCKIRVKLKRHAIEIETLWGAGYRITPENRARLMAVVSPELPEVESPPLAPVETAEVA